MGYSMQISAYKVYNKRLLKMKESIHVTFDKNKRGSENLLDPEEEEFRFEACNQDESGPSRAEDNNDNDRLVPSSGILSSIIPITLDQTIEDDDVQEDLAPLDKPTEEPGGDVKQPSQFRYRSSHPPGLILSNPQSGIQTRSSSIYNSFFVFNAFLS